MASSSLVSLISKKIIKPSTLTPPPLRSHKLSFVDQLLRMYVPIAFFYPKKCNDKSYEPSNVSQLLEKSLSKALSSYYPYAGRINDDFSINCNNTGVEFSHVRVHCPMSQILKHPYTDAENVVFPQQKPWEHKDEGKLAIAQVSYFDCGGIAVGGCLSHTIGDGCTAGNFFYNWGILNRDINATLSPHFVGESIYPQSNDPFVVSTIKPEEPGYLGKRFIFPTSKVNALKAKFSFDSDVQNPTRTEVVSALLYKCASYARKVNLGNSLKSSSLFQIANMRQKLKPPLSHDACGNIISGFFVETSDERDMNCQRLLSEMRIEKEKLVHDDKENAFTTEVVDSLKKGKKAFSSDILDYYFCSSLLSFPLYKTDFGWGTPTRVSFATGPFNRFFILMDNPSGVEAIVMLDEQDMPIFERDPELLEFATPPPNH